MKNKKFGFTLAEIMIVLSIIGILTAILMPIAFHSAPDQNVMKFKKADTTLKNVFRELVTSDKYYCDGDLGVKKTPDCRTLMSVNQNLYFCNSVADLLSVKENNCSEFTHDGALIGARLLSNESTEDFPLKVTEPNYRKVTPATIQATKEFFDSACKEMAAIYKSKNKIEIITTDGINYFQASSDWGFGGHKFFPSEVNQLTDIVDLRYFSPPDQHPANFADEKTGFDISYKVYCIDIDGVPNGATKDDCINECPFGYGIRADGKIMTGARADEWLEKDFQKGKNE